MFLIGNQEIVFLLSLALVLVFIVVWFIVGILIIKNKEKKDNINENIIKDKSSEDIFETDSITNDSDNIEASDSVIEINNENNEPEVVLQATQDIEENVEKLDSNDLDEINDSSCETEALEENKEEIESMTIEEIQEKENDEINNNESETIETKSEEIKDEQTEENDEINNDESETIETEPEEIKDEQLEDEKQYEEQASDKHVIVPTKKGRTYNGKYEIFQVADGYAYCLKASNGEVLVTSETYISRDGVIKAIEAVKRNLETGEVRIFADKRGKYKFKLVSKNYRVLAISSTYSVEKSAVRASESFKKFALKADIVDIELLDNDFESATIIEIKSNEDKSGGKFVIEKFNGEFSWDLKSSNGQILCQAEGYTSKAGCIYSIETFKKNVQIGVFKCIKDKSGRYCYKLYTPNGRVIAIGESYPTKASAEASANSVVSFYKLAAIEEIK